MKTGEGKWLSSLREIPEAPTTDLIRSIITSDGRGKSFKTAVLAEILSRILNADRELR